MPGRDARQATAISRKVVSHLQCSLDGIVSDPGRFVFDRVDYELLMHVKALIDAQDAVLLGRRLCRVVSRRGCE